MDDEYAKLLDKHMELQAEMRQLTLLWKREKTARQELEREVSRLVIEMERMEGYNA